jgi:hypothetical protein
MDSQYPIDGQGLGKEKPRNRQAKKVTAAPPKVITKKARWQQALKPITIRGVRYTVLRLSHTARGPRFVLRDDQGRIFGAWPGASSTFKAQLLEPVASSFNPLEDLVFSDAGDALTMRRTSQEDSGRGSGRYPRR